MSKDFARVALDIFTGGAYELVRLGSADAEREADRIVNGAPKVVRQEPVYTGNGFAPGGPDTSGNAGKIHVPKPKVLLLIQNFRLSDDGTEYLYDHEVHQVDKHPADTVAAFVEVPMPVQFDSSVPEQFKQAIADQMVNGIWATAVDPAAAPLAPPVDLTSPEGSKTNAVVVPNRRGAEY